jgi:hypothetical protein
MRAKHRGENVQKKNINYVLILFNAAPAFLREGKCPVDECHEAKDLIAAMDGRRFIAPSVLGLTTLFATSVSWMSGL